MSYPAIKITYWPFAGRTAVARLALAYAGIPYEFEAVDSAEWGIIKTDHTRFPTEDIPVFTVNGGRPIAQSSALTQFAGQLTGLWPTDAVAAATLSEIIATTEEILTGYFGTCLYKTVAQFNPGASEEELAKNRENFKEHFNFYAHRINDIINANPNKNFTVGDCLTVGANVEQEAHNALRSVARRGEERGPSVTVSLVGAHAQIIQEPNQSFVSFACGCVKGVTFVKDVRSNAVQVANDALVASARRCRQRRPSEAVFHFQLSTAITEKLDDGVVPVACGAVQRGASCGIGLVHIRFQVEETMDDAELSIEGGSRHGRLPLAISRIDISTAFLERTHDVTTS